MLTAIANAFRVPELRRKILFTLAIIALYRVGSFIPVPLLCALHFGDALRLGDDEARGSFLNRSREALIALAPPAA